MLLNYSPRYFLYLESEEIIAFMFVPEDKKTSRVLFCCSSFLALVSLSFCWQIR
ncbi:hypothetical protein HanRHA438_Chr05g0234841 [Helianthus annuus]|nr:hypothetical protein HanHA89_Chr05g0199601 [Helianthus annuus]KAJ0919892.1 hypothetical protein HanRHA438_Chr05g0234841 [Helianthus annuus]KAJ0945548.1 hypothetical protein HanPSC8_Chr03g0129381 [Helianthus annuus]